MSKPNYLTINIKNLYEVDENTISVELALAVLENIMVAIDRDLIDMIRTNKPKILSIENDIDMTEHLEIQFVNIYYEVASIYQNAKDFDPVNPWEIGEQLEIIMERLDVLLKRRYKIDNVKHTLGKLNIIEVDTIEEITQ